MSPDPQRAALLAAFDAALSAAKENHLRARIADIMLGVSHHAPFPPPKLSQDIRKRVCDYLDDEQWVSVAMMASSVNAQRHLEEAFDGQYGGHIAVAEYLGHLIAHGNPADLTALVEDVCLDGWAGFALPQNVSVDDDNIPQSLPPVVRHRIARMVDDVFARHPVLMEQYRLELEGVLLGNADEDGNAELAHRDAIGADEDAEPAQGEDAERELALESTDMDESNLLDDETQHTLGFITLDRLFSRPPQPRKWLYGRMLECGLVSLLVAPPGIGKTTVAGHIAIAVAAGVSWARQAVPAPGRVVYVNNEETPEETSRRLAASAKAMDISDPAAFSRMLVRHQDSPLLLMSREEGSPGLTNGAKALIRAMKQHKPDLLVLDSLAASHLLDENSNLDMTVFIGLLQRIARRFNCAVLLVHHVRKRTEGGSKLVHDATRGASAIPASARSVWMLAPAVDTPQQDGGEEDGLVRRISLHCVKANNIRLPAQPIDFRRGSVTLENGDEIGVLHPVEATSSPSVASQPRRQR